jgi:hypothetical protein
MLCSHCNDSSLYVDIYLIRSTVICVVGFNESTVKQINSCDRLGLIYFISRGTNAQQITSSHLFFQ